MQFNKTPLIMAAKGGQAIITQILLKAGADKNVKDDVSKYFTFFFDFIDVIFLLNSEQGDSLAPRC
jgi:ankyrin repeat protein